MMSISVVVVVILIAFAIFVNMVPRVHIPNHLSNHHAIMIDELIPEDIARELRVMLKDLTTFPSNVAVGTKSDHEHIGEGVPINSDGTCSHDYLFPNHNKTLCILPERVDVGRHYITTGGFDGK